MTSISFGPSAYTQGYLNELATLANQVQTAIGNGATKAQILNWLKNDPRVTTALGSYSNCLRVIENADNPLAAESQNQGIDKIVRDAIKGYTPSAQFITELQAAISAGETIPQLIQRVVDDVAVTHGIDDLLQVVQVYAFFAIVDDIKTALSMV